MRAKGWFTIPGVQAGDRSIDQQMLGLSLALLESKGKTVLDLGTAEGLLAREFARAGASRIHGIDSVKEHLDVARQQCAGFPITFMQHDLNRALLSQPYDIVLLLAICHKLKNPSQFAMNCGTLAKELLVLRLPPATAPIVVDERSGYKPHNIEHALQKSGLTLCEVTTGAYKEWVGYFRRA